MPTPRKPGPKPGSTFRPPAEIIAAQDEQSNPEADTIAKVRAASDNDDGEGNWLVRVTQPADPKKGERQEGWLFDCAPEDLETIRRRLLEEYGAGLYRVRVRRDNVMFSAFDVRIIVPPNYRAPAARGAAPANGEQSELVRMLAATLEKQNEKIDAIAAKLTASAPPAGNGVRAWLEEMKLFQDMLPKPAADQGLSMFEKGMAFAEKIVDARNGNSGDTNLFDLAREFIASPAAREIAAGLVGGARVAPAGATILPPQPITRTAPAAPRLAAASPDMSAQLTEGINYLVAQAGAGAQPDLFADYVIGLVPPAMLDAMEAAPDPFAMLQQSFPQVAPHRLWFEGLLKSLYEDDGPIEGGNDAGGAHDSTTPNRVNP